MLTKEEYANTVSRICKWKKSCYDCPLIEYAPDICSFERIDEMLDAIEHWAEEHPIKTNRDKFEEVFGVELKRNEPTRMPLCEQYKIDPIGCLKGAGTVCSYCSWWDEEYIEPKED